VGEDDDETSAPEVLAERADRIWDVQVSNATAESPPQPCVVRRRFPNALHVPALARAALVTATLGVPARAVADAELLVSELVTNSVRHTGSEWIDVVVTVSSQTLRVEVSDDDGSEVIRSRTPGADGGWGLMLVAGLATRWGVDHQGTGKTIWAELDLDAGEWSP
jgi:anti-sigma regulatory factor (Ser/Thr protein kinase)